MSADGGDAAPALLEVRGLPIAHVVEGPEDGEAIVLLRGLGTQMIEWPPGLAAGLVERGLRVIRLDNRDAGLSGACEADYGLVDMADDVIGLLDGLDIERAHVLGISMGGMIAQHLAISHGPRLRSLCSVMSSTGAPDLPRPAPEIMAALTERLPADAGAAIERAARNRALFGSPGWPQSEADRLAAARRAHERAFRPDGVARQMHAIVADGDRTQRLAAVRTPTLVIHGEDDPLVPLAAGEATARAIPGARLETIPGMGHDLPPELVPRLLELVAEHVEAARAA